MLRPTRAERARPYYGWVLTAALAVTVTTSYGAEYALGVFVRPMQAELGWTRAQLAAELTVAQLVAGVCLPLVGRAVDRHGARGVMTAGSALFAAALYARAHVHTVPAFLTLAVLLGVAMACVLYEVAFTVLARWFRRHRARATLLVTFAGALASTVFVPLAQWLVARQGWRGANTTLALVVAAVTVPTHALLLRRRPEDLGLHPDGEPAAAPDDGPDLARAARRAVDGGAGGVAEGVSARAALASRAFWTVAGGFVLAKLAGGALTLHLVPILSERGLAAAAAAGAAGAVGLAQLAGRVFFTPLAEGGPSSRVPLARLTAGVFAVHALALAALLASHSHAGGVPPGVWAFVVGYGASNGAITLARALLVADLFGTRHYGQITGWLALPVSLGTAVAPLAAGIARDALGNYDAVLAVLVGCTAAAAALLATLGRAAPGRAPLDGSPSAGASAPGARSQARTEGAPA